MEVDKQWFINNKIEELQEKESLTSWEGVLLDTLLWVIDEIDLPTFM